MCARIVVREGSAAVWQKVLERQWKLLSDRPAAAPTQSSRTGKLAPGDPSRYAAMTVGAEGPSDPILTLRRRTTEASAALRGKLSSRPSGNLGKSATTCSAAPAFQ